MKSGYHFGVGDEISTEISDKLTDLTGDVMEWLSSIPDVGAFMECDEGEGESTSMWSGDIKTNNESGNVSMKLTKRLKLSLSSLQKRRCYKKVIKEGATSYKKVLCDQI